MKTGFLMITALMSLSSAMYGQAAPTAVAGNGSGSATSLAPSPGGLKTDGTIHYSLSASEIFQHGLFSGPGTYYTTSLSGSAGYVSESQRLPFSMLYAGGLLLTTQSQSTVQTFQNLALSQEFVTPRWVFGVSDSVSYLPQSPTTGYSGISGTGDLGPIQGPSQGPAGGILTNYGNRVSNSLDGNLERKLTASTSVSGSADWSILRFINNTGLDTTSISGTAGLNHRLDGRTTISGTAVYSIFTYGSYGAISDELGLSGLSFQTRGLNLSVQRLVSHNLSVSVSAGPQLISSSNSLLIPKRTTVAATVGATYTHRLSTFSLSYNRGANGGSGVQQGSLMDSVVGSYTHSYGRDWQMAVTGSYANSEALITNQQVNEALGVNGTYNSVYGGVQVSRRLSVHASAYASYTAVEQSNTSSASVPSVYSGVGSIFAIGVTWTPRSTRLGQF